MEAKVLLVFCLLLLAQCTLQQTSSKRRNGKKDSNNGAIEELKKQINDIIQELNLLKEQQALQTGNASDIRTMDTSRWLKKYYVT